MALIDVDLDTLPDSDAVPAGRYKLRIDEVTAPKFDKNNIKFVGITYTIIEGEYINRKVPEPYVPLTGKSTLKKITKAAGFGNRQLKDTDELVTLTLEAYLRVEKSDEFGEQNRIATYAVPGETAPAAPPKPASAA